MLRLINERSAVQAAPNTAFQLGSGPSEFGSDSGLLGARVMELATGFQNGEIRDLAGGVGPFCTTHRFFERRKQLVVPLMVTILCLFQTSMRLAHLQDNAVAHGVIMAHGLFEPGLGLRNSALVLIKNGDWQVDGRTGEQLLG